MKYPTQTKSKWIFVTSIIQGLDNQPNGYFSSVAPNKFPKSVRFVLCIAVLFSWLLSLLLFHLTLLSFEAFQKIFGSKSKINGLKNKSSFGREQKSFRFCAFAKSFARTFTKKIQKFLYRKTINHRYWWWATLFSVSKATLCIFCHLWIFGLEAERRLTAYFQLIVVSVAP